MPASSATEEGTIVEKPHPHDILCGRGGQCNSHPGNEWFRRLVRSNRPLYRSCPKHTKLLVSKAVVQAVQAQDPPGRFLELKNEEQVWRTVSYKKSVGKASQALREREKDEVRDKISPIKELNEADPNEISAAIAGITMKNHKLRAQDDPNTTIRTFVVDSTKSGAQNVSVQVPSQDAAVQPVRPKIENRKRKPPTPKPTPNFVKPAWWSRGAPPQAGVIPSFPFGNKRQRTSTSNGAMYHAGRQDSEDQVPLPPKPLESRQSSLFRFLSGTSIFGGKPPTPPPSSNVASAPQLASADSLFGSSNGAAKTSNLSESVYNSDVGKAARMLSLFSRDPAASNVNQQNVGQGTSLLDAAEQVRRFDEQMKQNRSSVVYENMVQQNAPSMPGMGEVEDRKPPARPPVTTSIEPVALSTTQSLFSSTFGPGNGNGSRPKDRKKSAKFKNMSNDDFEPVPLDESNSRPSYNPVQQAEVYKNMRSFMQNVEKLKPAPERNGLGSQANSSPSAARLPTPSQLTTQVSDWLSGFWTTDEKPTANETAENPPAPTLESGISTTFLKLASTPSQLFTSLKSGVTAYFGGTQDNNGQRNSMIFGSRRSTNMPNMGSFVSAGNVPRNSNAANSMFGMPAGSFGAQPNQRPSGSSLLDDYEETPSETRLRNVSSI